MSINLNIDGVSKNVISPEVNIDGVWRQVNIVSNNIDGVWKESFNRNVYKVKLYRYGVLYDTLTVLKGSSVQLPSVANVYDDDIAHYGWTKTAGATSRDYSATAKITPTADMDLYAVFSYEIIETTTLTTTIKSNQSAIHEQTFTFPLDCTAKIYGWDLPYGANLTLQTSGNTVPYIIYNGRKQTGTLSQTQCISIDVTANSVMTFGMKALASTPNGDAGTAFKIEYLGYKSTTQYRSSYGNYIVSLYYGDTLYETTEVAQGTTYILPHYTTDKNNVLLGWSITPDSTVVKYDANAIIRPTSDLTLYAIYADYSYLDTDGDGYFTFTGCRVVITDAYSMNGSHTTSTDYGNYSMTITFTDGSTKTITLGNAEGETTVRFDSAVGISELNVPESSTSTESGDTYRVSTTHSYKCTAQRYLYKIKKEE